MTYCDYSCDVQRETHRNKWQSAYRRPKRSDYYEENFSQLQIKNYTHSNWLGFGCPILYVTISIHWGKQMPPGLAVLLAFSIETVDWLDNSKMTRLTDQACSGVFFQRHAQYRQVDRVPLAECLLCGGQVSLAGAATSIIFVATNVYLWQLPPLIGRCVEGMLCTQAQLHAVMVQ